LLCLQLQRLISIFNWYSGGGGDMESNWVHSALRPSIGLLCRPRVIMMMEKLVECLAGETEILWENVPRAALSHHKPPCCPDAKRAAAVGSQRLTAWASGTAVWSVTQRCFIDYKVEQINFKTIFLKNYFKGCIYFNYVHSGPSHSHTNRPTRKQLSQPNRKTRRPINHGRKKWGHPIKENSQVAQPQKILNTDTKINPI
jgi:hypothetical protein